MLRFLFELIEKIIKGIFYLFSFVFKGIIKIFQKINEVLNLYKKRNKEIRKFETDLRKRTLEASKEIY